jgi:hypothetical protein
MLIWAGRKPNDPRSESDIQFVPFPLYDAHYWPLSVVKPPQLYHRNAVIRQVNPRFDPNDGETIRSQVGAICQMLEDEIAKLKAGTAGFEIVEEVYRTQIQPRAYALAEAMLHHVPDNDPRIMMIVRMGDFRSFQSDDMTMIDLSLSEETAESHLWIIVDKLRALTGYLPKVT